VIFDLPEHWKSNQGKQKKPSAAAKETKFTLAIISDAD
jgi:hypothetical protein